MTTCVVANCGNHKALVFCADRQLGLGHVHNILGNKIRQIHPNWRLMFAGGDTQPIFDIIDRIKSKLVDKNGAALAKPTTQQVRLVVQAAWADELNFRTQAKIFGKREGWTLERFFNEGKDHFPPSDTASLIEEIEREQFDLEIIVAGFNEQNRPEILYGSGSSDGILNRESGYSAIGSGGTNALTFLSWRETTPATPIRGAIAHVAEAKLYGELAPEVSEETDVVVLLSDGTEIALPEEVVEDVLMQKIAIPNRPPNMKMKQLELLNNIAELAQIPYVWSDAKLKLVEVPYDKDTRPKRTRDSGKKPPTAVPIVSGAAIIPETDQKPRRTRRSKQED
jgi:ATP-dependent protease HslVU (ClpYQ) peptidase subunit